MSKKFTRDDVELIKKETPFKGFFQIDRYHLRHRRFDGSWSPVMDREIFERRHAAGCLLFDPDLDVMLFIEQFRPGAYAAHGHDLYEGEHSPWLIECVAGIIESGESPESLIRREAVEEAGVSVGQMEKIAHYLVSPGGTSESITLFMGQIDASNAGGLHGLDVEHEDIRAFTMPTVDAIAWLDSGAIDNAMTLIAMQWFKMNVTRLRKAWKKAD